MRSNSAHVVLSNRRGPATLAVLVAELGPRARAATPVEAAAASELVVVTIPLPAYRTVPVEPLRGKTVIDTNNYYPAFQGGAIDELEAGTTTISELLQTHLPASHVVRAFSNIGSTHLAKLARPSGAPDRSALALAGDDAHATQQVTAFLDTIGYDAVDAGILAEGWRFEQDTPAYSDPYFSEGHSTTAALQGGDPGPGQQVTADTLRHEDLADAGIWPQKCSGLQELFRGSEAVRVDH
ncbi:NADPH-dependent F420 reductase [Streptomyces sp. NPDC056987]|uniref:NADPH-dependent F420 reductase n=1 Tax=Streptomyces sp. NPDC056987 TaxID=3345988 RepID=UPI003634EE4A